MIAASLLLAFGGFALLAIAMPRHAKRALFGRVVAVRSVRLGALTLFFLSAATRGFASNWRFSLIEWIGELTLAALAATLLLTYLPEKLMGAGVVALLGAAVAICMSVVTH